MSVIDRVKSCGPYRLLRGLRRRYRALRELRRRLEAHPGHFRGLILGFARNAARLATLKLGARISGRRLTAIGLAERMGDIVACEPVSRELRDRFPGDVIVWALRANYAELVEGNPHVDRVVRIHCVTEWIWLRKLGLFDRTCDLHIHEKHCGACQVRLNKDDKEIDIANYYNYGALLHSFSRSAGYPMDGGDPAVYIGHAARRAVDGVGQPRRYVVVHTASEEDCRNWERGKWERLVGHIIGDLGLAVVEIGQRSGLGRPAGGGYLDLCGKCGLLESAEVIRRAALFVGIDSGPAHLANAVRARGVVLLGSYRAFRRYMPYTGFYADPDNCRIVRHDGPARDIPLEECIAAVDEALRAGSPRIPADLAVTAGQVN